jgi:cytochrome c peroxidase
MRFKGMKNYVTIASLLMGLLMIASCKDDDVVNVVPTSPQLAQFGILPDAVRTPADNPITPDKVQLGRMLFWDPILSGNKDVACVTCHHPNNGYAENLDLSLGVGGLGLSASRQSGTLVKRNSMTILNTAYNSIKSDGSYDPLKSAMFWDNRVASLEEQALKPIGSEEEMRGHAFTELATMDTIVARLRANSAYTTLFNKAFGSPSITKDRVAKAIATFERTLIANNSPFDQYQKGNTNALSNLQIQGLQNFINAGCNGCHNGPMFSDFEFHRLGIPDNARIAKTDTGAGTYLFRTGSLRNLSSTGPYMHNGKLRTLEEVFDFYDNTSKGRGTLSIPLNQVDPKVRNLRMGGNQKQAIVAFLQSLSDPNFDRTIPTSVPSGLNPGGNIK